MKNISLGSTLVWVHIKEHFLLDTEQLSKMYLMSGTGLLTISFINSQSEEDKQLQEDLEMMVERLSVSILSFSRFSLVCESIKQTVSRITCRKRTQLCTILHWRNCAGRFALQLLP